MKNLLYFFLITLLVLSCSRCKEEDCTDSTNPDCPNYVAPVDPCAGKTEVSAEFKIEMEIAFNGTTWYETDECLSGINTVRVTSLWEDASSYTWILGVDTFYTQQHIFAVPSEYDGQSLPVKLIINAPPQTDCFPNDNGMDTVLKYIHVRSICDADIWGTYRGAWDSAPADSFEIKIQLPVCDEPDAILYELVNIDQQGDSCNNAIWDYANDYVRFSTGNNNCSSARGFAKLEEDKVHVRIEYRLFDSNQPLNPELWPLRIYRGRKLN